MTIRERLARLSIAFCSVLSLASMAEAQTSPIPGATPVPAGAERLSYGVDAGIGESDNVTLATNNKVSQTMTEVDMDFDVKHRSRRLDVDAKGNFTDFDYLEGIYGNQLIGRFDGIGQLALIPRRLNWVLQDDYGQAALDAFAPVTPVNIESINFVSTGPDLTLRLGGTGFLDMSARLARADYQTSPLSSNRVLGSLGTGRQLSARSSVSLNGVIERVLFENTAINGDFNRTSGFLRYQIQGARTGLSVDLGATKVKQSASGPRFVLVNGVLLPLTFGQSASSTTGPLAKLTATRRLSETATLTLSAGRELTDASSSFSGIQAGALGAIGTASAALTSSSYTTNYASLGWQYARNRTTIAVSGHWERDVYPSQPQFDLTRGGAEINVNRKLTRAISLRVLGRYYKSDYIHGNLLPLLGAPKFDDGLVAAAVVWRHGRALEVRFRGEHSFRTTTPGGSGYAENRLFLTVGYRPKPDVPEDSPPELLPSNNDPRA